MNIVLGVGGGIAAYKVVSLLRLLCEAGHDVTVVPTSSALRFVGEPTWAAISGRPIATDVWTNVHEVPHVRLGQQAALVVVAPATADVIAKSAHGIADDLLGNLLLTARCPILMAPAMHTEMWLHPATRANVAVLRSRGVQVLEPATGRLTGADTGPGRLPEPEELAWTALRLLARHGSEPDLAGRHVVITAGGTREALDPVRFLGNRSSGRQGYALARTAIARGARHVTLIAANTSLPEPAGVELISVVSTNELYDATLAASIGADALVMAAAPADFRPAKVAEYKIKKDLGGQAPVVELLHNPDILREVVRRRADGADGPRVIVGFAAETGDDEASVLDHGRAKLAKKGCDLLVVNEVTTERGFESPDNAAVILGTDGSTKQVPYGPKADLADAVWDSVVSHLTS